MGFSFNPLKGVTRAFGIPDSARHSIQSTLDVVFPVHFLANTVAGKGISVVGKWFQPKNQNVSQSALPQRLGQDPFQVEFQAPSYQAPYYGGSGYDAFSFQPQSPYGGSPWGYSTMYSQPLIQQYPVYSEPQDRTWETLVEAALPFFL